MSKEINKKDFKIKETKVYSDIKKGYTYTIQSYLNQHPEVKPYLTTFRFNNIPLNHSYCPYQYKFLTNLTWKFYHKVYYHLASTLTNNITKKPYLFPKTFDFLDVDHTGKTKLATFTETTIPHIHSIYLIHDKLLDKFHSHISNQFQSITNHHSLSEHIRTIHAEPITTDLPRAVSYCSKFYDIYQARIIRDKIQYEFYHQHPLGKDDLQTLANERKDRSSQMISSSNEEMRERFTTP